MKKTIKVTREHIKKGDNFSHSCPVALAIKEQTNLLSVWVGKKQISSGSGGFPSFPSPRSVSRFVKKFDACKTVKPFNFIFDTNKGSTIP